MFADVDNNGTIDPNTEILQEDHYYAFGLRIEGLSSSNKDNKFTYNGKELEDDFNLNWYHYGARYYDPALGRWHSVDPVDEFNSPYLGIGNNPIILIDNKVKDVWVSKTLSSNEKLQAAVKIALSTKLGKEAYEAMANNKDIIYAFYNQKYDDAVGSHYLGGRQPEALYEKGVF